jgi:hypothetical protein
VRSNGFLPGRKAGEQHVRTQQVQDAGIPARLSSHVPHSPWCEDRAFAGPGLLQTMTDVGQALTIRERRQRHTGYRLVFEWPQWRGREMAPESREPHQQNLEQWRSCQGSDMAQAYKDRQALDRERMGFVNDQHNLTPTFVLCQ